MESYRSPSNPKAYKRYLGTPIRYAGGKTLAVGFIIEKLPNRISRVASPFFGGGSVEIAIANELGVPVIGYDIFDVLTTYWKYQINDPEGLYKELLKFKPTKEEYYRVKKIVKKHWDGDKRMTGLNLAAHYFFNHNTSYGPHFLGWPSSVYLQEKRYLTAINKVRNFKTDNLHVKPASFEKIMDKHRDDFLYCDPPYYLDGDSKTFVGMYPHRNFPIHHVGFRHGLLRDFLHKHRGGFVLSYNNCSTIRDWYSKFEIETPRWQYTFSQGDTRIGENRKKNNNGSYIKKSHELLIYKPPKI
ncbi:DNA adenine methylase [Patescibacteria group bacterium]|nr:DNA adenine methylase [Patescibacteria group bacterium]